LIFRSIQRSKQRSSRSTRGAAGWLRELCPHGLPHHNPNTLIGRSNSATAPGSLQQFETHPRQHVEDDAEGQNKLRCDTEECTDENLTRQNQCEPSAVERLHGLAGGHEAQEQRREPWNAARGSSDGKKLVENRY
jgi:hypothetical protein